MSESPIATSGTGTAEVTFKRDTGTADDQPFDRLDYYRLQEWEKLKAEERRRRAKRRVFGVLR